MKKAHDRKILAEIIDLSADAVISVDNDHNIVWVNAAFESIFGYKDDEILGQSLNILLPESIHSVHDSYVNAYGNSAEKARYMGDISDLYGLTRSGRQIPLDISIQKHPEGSFCRYTAICRDISDRLAREKYIRESEAKLSKLFNSSHQFTILMDGDGEVMEFNSTAEQLLREEPEKYIGRKIWDCDFWASETDSSLIQEAMSRVKAEKDNTLIIDAFGRDNRKITLEITLKVIWMDHENSMQIVLEGNDITALIRSNKALMASKSRLARAQKIAFLGNWEWKIAADEVIYSEGVYSILGIEPTEFGVSYESLIMKKIHPQDRDRVEQALVEALKGNNPYHVSHRITLPDGTEKVVEQWAEIRRTKGGDAIQMDGIIQDITERWNREQELVIAKSQAEEANIAKAQFLSAISHELRTPLNAIIGFSSMIAEEHMGEMNIPTYRDYATDINNSGKDLLGLIQNILQVTNFELGSVEFKPCRLTAGSLLDTVVPIMSTRAADKNIHIETRVSDDIPDLHLDMAHTRLILVHLVDNAIKFSKSGDIIKINLSYREKEFIIDVIDQGIGLEDADKGAIFDLFVQKGMKGNKIYGGVGLGLTIVKNLAEIQGGRVQADSVAGLGSCFSVCFPDVAKEEAPATDIGLMA